MKRIAIFQCCDKKGIIDDYIPYLLKDLKKNLDKLVIIVNGLLSSEGRKKLELLTPYVVCRENKGFDAAAWKYAMTEYIGWEELSDYDELVLLNDTFFGPFYPFEDVFTKMSARGVDFWGLTQHKKVNEDPLGNNPYGYWPTHLQSYFLCINHKMHSSPEFKEYWGKQPVYESWADLVGKNETVFTKYFEDKGFTWDSYISNGDTDKLYGYNPYNFNTYEILCKGYPVIKRKEFAAELGLTLQFNNAEDYRRSLEWIKKNTSYDTKMIFQNILRNYNIADIYSALHLNYIISDSSLEKSDLAIEKTCVILHISYTEKLERYVPFVQNIPEAIDIFVTTTSEEKKQIISEHFSSLKNKLTIIVMQNRGRDIAGLLVAARPYIENYKYLCFCHDKISKQTVYTLGNSFERILWENTLKSSEYILNVLSKLSEDDNLGVLAVPSPISANFIYPLGTHWWGKSFSVTQKLLHDLGISVPLDQNKNCLTIGTAFWCKVDALKPLWTHQWKYEDFPKEPLALDGCLNHGVERSFAFIAQSQGYYTGVAMTNEWASVLINDYKYAFLNDYLWKRHGVVYTDPYSDIDYISRHTGVKKSFKILKRSFHIWLWKITKSKKL